MDDFILAIVRLDHALDLRGRRQPDITDKLLDEFEDSLEHISRPGSAVIFEAKSNRAFFRENMVKAEIVGYFGRN